MSTKNDINNTENIVPQRIIEFIGEHHILSLATSINNQPYCATCFYVYLEEENCFVFTSDLKTRHAKEILENENVAATIALETKTIGKIRGLQILGKCQIAEGDLQSKARKKYLKEFPFAILKMTKLWVLKVDYFKMTDNRLGFGKKLIWSENFNK